MVPSEILLNIESLERDPSLFEEANFVSRAEAIDFLDFHVLERIEGLLHHEAEDRFVVLQQRAAYLKGALENVDAELFKRFRGKISAGDCTGAIFKEMICKYVGIQALHVDQTGKIGYDDLDVFINGLLSDQVIPEATMERLPEMVFYQKTPARIIFELVERAGLQEGDVFFDLGSGLGQAVILVNLMSGAIANGIEYEPAYCEYAVACAAQLNLGNVVFINQDAHKGDYSRGTVFFMYTPFEGNMLQHMLEILKLQSQQRTIRIFTYGHCSAYVSQQAWLNCVEGNADHDYKLYEFSSGVAY